MLIETERGLSFCLIVRFRNRKYRRWNENKAWVNPKLSWTLAADALPWKRTQFVLHEIPSFRSLCPVSHFLALALADSVFESISKASDLSTLAVPSSCNTYTLSYKSKKRDLPVFPSSLHRSRSGTEASQGRIVTVEKLGAYLRDLGMRAGYKESLDPYNFRRGQAHKLDGEHNPPSNPSCAANLSSRGRTNCSSKEICHGSQDGGNLWPLLRTFHQHWYTIRLSRYAITTSTHQSSQRDDRSSGFTSP